jgi:PAS domain S-box-containing protein
MGESLHNFNWSTTPLGPLELWSPSLKTAFDLMMASPVATSLVCGPQRVLLYNVASIPIYGAKHPEALGAPLPRALPALWTVIGPICERVFAGEAISVKAQPWRFDESDVRRGRHYDAYFTPGRDDRGAIAFVQLITIVSPHQARTTAKLREDVQRFSGLFSASPAPLLVLRPDAPRFTIREANDAYLAATMRTRDTIVGRGIFEAFPDNPGDETTMGVKTLRASLEKVVASKQPDTLPELKYDVARPDGTFEERWWSPVNAPVLDENGELEAVIHHVRDVTKVRCAEIALRQSEERQTLLLKLSDALRPLAETEAVVDRGCQILVDALNASRAQFTEVTGDLGYEIGQVSGEYVRFGQPMTRRYSLAAFGEKLVAELRTGKTLVLTDTYRDPRLTEDQRAAFAAVESPSAVAVPLVEGVRLIATFTIHDQAPREWTGHEIAIVEATAERIWSAFERARAEVALRESEERLHLIVASARDYAIFTTDMDGKVDDWHRGAASVFGYCADEIIGRDSSVLFTPEDRAAGEVEKELETARTQGSVPNIRWHLRKDEARVFIEGRTVALRNGEGVLRGFLKIGQDVTARIEAESALRDSEERLRLSLRAGRLAAWDWNLASGDVSWNDEHFRVLGYAVEEVAPSFEAWAARVHPDDIDGTIASLNIAAERREHYHHEFRLLLPGGTVRWCNAQGMYFYGDGGDAVRMIGVMEDVTQRRQFEQTLFQSEERFRQFAENSADVLWIADATQAPPRLEFLNAAFERVWGSSRLGVVGNIDPFLSFVHSDDRGRVSDMLPRLLAGEPHTAEYRIIRPDTGEVRWILDTGFAVRDGSGRIIRVAGIATDVTDRKRAEAGVQESRRRLRALIEGMPQLVWRAVGSGEWVWASPQWTEFTGQPTEQSHGLGWLAMVHEDDRLAAKAAWERAVDSGGFEMTGRLKKADSTYRWFQTRATPVRDEDGAIVEWLGTCTDVDDLHRLQEEQKVLVAELQHRTRNLLAVVRSVGGQTLATSMSLEDFGDRFNDRLHALSRVQGLLSRSEQEPITIGALVHAELDALAASIGTGRVVVEGPDVALRNSTVQTLSLALHELATNARKYGALSNDRGVLTVRWHVRECKQSSILDIEWLEENEQPVAREPSREGRGYGRKLIERALPYALNAETDYVLDEKGVRCRISLPLARREGDPL